MLEGVPAAGVVNSATYGRASTGIGLGTGREEPSSSLRFNLGRNLTLTCLQEDLCQFPVLASCPLYSSLVVQDPHAPPCLQAFDPAILGLSLHMAAFFSSFAPLLLSLLLF